VEQAAQGTDSHQMARGLLIGEGGEIFHRPELEIYADDVKCGHGAATGALDENQMFYLQSRGIEEAEARRMLLAAYFAPIVDSAPEALSAALANWVDVHLLSEGRRS
jgi:Fe-S cluster assembly protein SufD